VKIRIINLSNLESKFSNQKTTLQSVASKDGARPVSLAKRTKGTSISKTKRQPFKNPQPIKKNMDLL